MSADKNDPIRDLFDWDLSQAGAQEYRLITEITSTKPAIPLDRDTLGAHVHEMLLQRIRELAHTTISETLTYWLENSPDAGIDCLQMGVEFPYLQLGSKGLEPLTMSCFIESDDGARTEIKRVDLNEALMQLPWHHPDPARLHERIKIVAARLRALATRIEGASAEY